MCVYVENVCVFMCMCIVCDCMYLPSVLCVSSVFVLLCEYEYESVRCVCVCVCVWPVSAV